MTVSASVSQPRRRGWIVGYPRGNSTFEVARRARPGQDDLSPLGISDIFLSFF